MTITIHAPIAIAQTSCNGLIISLPTDDDTAINGYRYVRNSNNNLDKNLIITLEDGFQIIGEDAHGIDITADGSCEITINAKGTANLITGGKGKSGILITDGSSDTTTKTITLNVDDVTSGTPNMNGDGSDAISVVGVRGSINIKSDGTIRSNGEMINGESNGTVHVRLTGSNVSNLQKTMVSVHNVISDSTYNGGGIAAAVMVASPGDATINSTGEISTTKDLITGVYVELRNSQHTNPGSANITVNDITTNGQESHGIRVVRNLNTAVSSIPVNITVNGELRTKGKSAHGVEVLGPNIDLKLTINEQGSITTEDPADLVQVGDNPLPGSKILSTIDSLNSPPASIQSVLIRNYGLIEGGIDIESCMVPELINSGTFNSGETVNLKHASVGCGTVNRTITTGQITNNGIVSPGGTGTIETTNAITNFVQSDTGILEIDVNWSNLTSDQLNILKDTNTGGEATLQGLIRTNNIKLYTPEQFATLDEGERLTVTVMSAEGGITGLPQVEFANSLLMKRGINLSNSGKDLQLWISPIKTVTGLNQNQRNILQEVTASYGINDTLSSVYKELLNKTVLSNLQFELDALGNEIAGASIQSTIRSSFHFAQVDSSCTTNHALSISTFLCTDFEISDGKNKRQQSFEERNHHTDFTKAIISTGLQTDNSNTGMELFFGINNTKTVIPNLAHSDGKLKSFWLKIFGTTGPINYKIAAGYSQAKHTITRNIPFNQLTAIGKMHTDNKIVNVEAFYETRADYFILTPFVGIGMVDYHSNAYQESGAGDLSLNVDAVDGKTVQTRAGIKIGTNPIKTSLVNIEPHIHLTAHNASSRQINIDSKFAGSKNIVRSTTNLLSSGWEINVGTKLKSNLSRLIGHAGLSYTQEGNSQSSQTSATMGFMFEF